MGILAFSSWDDCAARYIDACVLPRQWAGTSKIKERTPSKNYNYSAIVILWYFYREENVIALALDKHQHLRPSTHLDEYSIFLNPSAALPFNKPIGLLHLFLFLPANDSSTLSVFSIFSTASG
jgi:hypothetical protein